MARVYLYPLEKQAAPRDHFMNLEQDSWGES
jgi:hypothetical protein